MYLVCCLLHNIFNGFSRYVYIISVTYKTKNIKLLSVILNVKTKRVNKMKVNKKTCYVPTSSNFVKFFTKKIRPHRDTKTNHPRIHPVCQNMRIDHMKDGRNEHIFLLSLRGDFEFYCDPYKLNFFNTYTTYNMTSTSLSVLHVQCLIVPSGLGQI